MKWLIYQKVSSDLETANYANSIKIAYLLNLKLVSVGIDESSYMMVELAEYFPFDFKMEHLLAANADSPKDYAEYADFKQILKDVAKLKNKSSKQIVAINMIKKTINNCFKDLVDFYFEKLSNIYQIEKFKPLLETDVFYFYRNTDNTIVDDKNCFAFSNDVLQLNLQDEKNGNPMFFLSNFKNGGSPMEIDFLNPNDKNAEYKNNFYGELSYIFPLMDALTSNELISTRKELEKTTEEFRTKIDEWATICYANPNTNLGLDYFRKNLQPFLQSSKNEVLKNPLLKNISSLTQKKLETQIIIGEAPIEKIWELYLVSKTITQEVFDNLMKAKTEKFPKFEGRWPIVFFNPTEDAKNYINDEAHNDGVKSIRKSISLD